MIENIFVPKEGYFKPTLDMPYYGRQASIFPFFADVVKDLVRRNRWRIPEVTYAETNSGCCSNAYEFARMGYTVVTNDLSAYSYSVAEAAMGHLHPTMRQSPLLEILKESDELIDAAVCAALVSTYGYNVTMENIRDAVGSAKFLAKYWRYRDHLKWVRGKLVGAKQRTRMDLFEFLKQLEPVKIIFMDFAWPWRTGNETQEYATTVDTLSSVLGYHVEFKPWTKATVMENVRRAVSMAKKKADVVLLSNQSSNYPDPETLEVSLWDAGIGYRRRYTLTKVATMEDNLLKDKYFVEYLYEISVEK